MSDLVPLPDADLAHAAGYARQALSPATLAAYAADWEDFEAWCQTRGVPALLAAPTTVAAFLVALASTHARATLRRWVAAIGRAHRMVGHPWAATHPALRDTLAGIARQHGTPARRAGAIGTAEIRRLVATCSDGLTGTRDRALLLSFARALRRSELVDAARRYGRGWGSRRGSNQGNTQNEKSLYHQSSIDFRCYLELARFEPRLQKKSHLLWLRPVSS
jgi:hypothetical protein